MKCIRKIIFAMAMSFAAVAVGDYACQVECSEAGMYVIEQSETDVVLSGVVNGDVTLTLPENCRVTLFDVALSGTLTINGDAELWLVGDSAVATADASAIACSGALTIGGDGTLAASAAGAGG